jgi:hypothetical protein
MELFHHWLDGGNNFLERNQPKNKKTVHDLQMPAFRTIWGPKKSWPSRKTPRNRSGASVPD